MRYKIDRNHKITCFLCLLLGMILLTGSMRIPVYAAEYWPEGPEVVSPNVIVMEASTGTVLYDRSANENFVLQGTEAAELLSSPMQTQNHHPAVRHKITVLLQNGLWK